MLAKLVVFTLAGLIASVAMADDKDCDNCNKAAEVKFLVCLKKAKTDADKKECDQAKDKSKKVCQFSVCLKKPF